MYWGRTCLYLDGLSPVPAGSLQDRIRLTAWYKREQFRIFEALINVYANVISSNPDIIKKVEAVIDEYIELVVPGSGEAKKAAQDSFIKSQSSALNAIYDVLKTHNDGLTKKKR